MIDTDLTIGWLLGSDPSIRWQVQRDVLGAPETEWVAQRRKVEHEGWGARLLACADPDGQWAGGAFVPHDFDWREWQEVGQPWTGTSFALSQLRELGLDPASERARRAVELVGANARWDQGGQPYWEGEVEECINGRTLADGAYFGVDVSSIAARLIRGWLTPSSTCAPGARRTADGSWSGPHRGGSGSRSTPG